MKKLAKVRKNHDNGCVSKEETAKKRSKAGKLSKVKSFFVSKIKKAAALFKALRKKSESA